MHEYSIVQALVQQVGRVAAEASPEGAASVERIQVILGELSGVEPDLLATAYEVFREKTVCAGAELAIRTVPARWVCPRCDRPFVRGEVLRCPDCHVPARLASGDEILLERIEMEVS